MRPFYSLVYSITALLNHIYYAEIYNNKASALTKVSLSLSLRALSPIFNILSEETRGPVVLTWFPFPPKTPPGLKKATQTEISAGEEEMMNIFHTLSGILI